MTYILARSSFLKLNFILFFYFSLAIQMQMIQIQFSGGTLFQPIVHTHSKEKYQLSYFSIDLYCSFYEHMHHWNMCILYTV